MSQRDRVVSGKGDDFEKEERSPERVGSPDPSRSRSKTLEGCPEWNNVTWPGPVVYNVKLLDKTSTIDEPHDTTTSDDSPHLHTPRLYGLD